jgi:sulfur oxidation c-type cytochrome SoxX
VPAFFVILLILVPLIDRNPQRNPFRRPIAMTCLVLYGGLVLTMTVIGYLSPGLAQPETSPASAQSSPQGQSKQPQGQKSPESPQDAAAVEKGKKVFESQGCIACHSVHGKGGSVGPELSGNTLEGRSRKWLEDQIRNPQSHFPNTVMPPYSSLSKEQVDNLVSYLMSLVSGGQPASSPQPSSQSPAKQQQEVREQRQSPPEQSAIERGKKVFESSGCMGCHKVHGKGGSVGPELAGPTLQGKSKHWLIEQITNSKAHFPSMGPNTGMTEFTGMGKQDLSDLADYLMSLVSGGAVPSAQQPTPSPSPESTSSGIPSEEKASGETVGEAAYIIGSPDNGADLYNEQCSSCHGSDGKGGVKNPGSEDGTVPPLNPIDRELYDSNPKIFAEKIDKIIQHGSMPKGSNPALHMPAWGDSRSLTQSEIANLEAYLLKLNGVDRGMIFHPGMDPQSFFFMVVGVFVLALLLFGGYWSKKREQSGKGGKY